MTYSRTYKCPKCLQKKTIEGATKRSIGAKFANHVLNCKDTPPSPAFQFHSKKQQNDGKGGLLGRIFKRKPLKKDHLLASPSITQSLQQILESLDHRDDQFMADLETQDNPSTAPPSTSSPVSSSPPTPPTEDPPHQLSDTLEKQATHYQQYGFDFKHRNVVMNFRDFQKVREYFLLQNRYVALAELYSIFVLSYVEFYGGYGLDDHKKREWLNLITEIRETLEHLKGGTHAKTPDPDLERYSEINLNIKFEAAIEAATMDTLSAREQDKHERLIKLAEAFIASSEESGELKNLMQELQQKEGSS